MTDEGFNLNLAISSYGKIFDLSQKKIYLFNEIPLLKSLHTEQIVNKFSNSFLIECKI